MKAFPISSLMSMSLAVTLVQASSENKHGKALRSPNNSSRRMKSSKSVSPTMFPSQAPSYTPSPAPNCPKSIEVKFTGAKCVAITNDCVDNTSEGIPKVNANIYATGEGLYDMKLGIAAGDQLYYSTKMMPEGDCLPPILQLSTSTPPPYGGLFQSVLFFLDCDTQTPVVGQSTGAFEVVSFECC